MRIRKPRGFSLAMRSSSSPLFAAHPEGVTELAAAVATPVESDPLAIESLAAVGRSRPTGHAGLGTRWRPITTGCATRSSSAFRFSCRTLRGAKWIGGVFNDTVHADDAVSIAIHDVPASFCRHRWRACSSTSGTELVPSPNETTGHRHAHQPAERRRATKRCCSQWLRSRPATGRGRI